MAPYFTLTKSIKIDVNVPIAQRSIQLSRRASSSSRFTVRRDTFRMKFDQHDSTCDGTRRNLLDRDGREPASASAIHVQAGGRFAIGFCRYGRGECGDHDRCFVNRGACNNLTGTQPLITVDRRLSLAWFWASIRHPLRLDAGGALGRDCRRLSHARWVDQAAHQRGAPPLCCRGCLGRGRKQGNRRPRCRGMAKGRSRTYHHRGG